MIKHTVRNTGKNTREVVTSALTVLISYETPVAVKYHGDGASGVARTNVRYSRSTEQHITDFCGYNGVATFDQADLDGILTEVTGGKRLPVSAARMRQGYSGNDGELADTENIDYSAHTLAGDKHLVVPVSRRRSYR